MFFGDRKKLRLTRILMGTVNMSALFSWMMEEMRQIWQKKSDDIPITHTTTENIIDDVFLAAFLYDVMMVYFDIVAETLKHYRCTLKLAKCRFFCFKVEFVGIDVAN